MAYRNGYSADDRDLDNDGGKPHIIEHLATFTVNQETGIMYPSDGMRRLLQLEQTNGIWSQKMHLSLDHEWVLIMDYETGNVMERFPANYIQEPTAFTSQDPMEMYNNILVFIVTNSNQSYPEMHIFQCQSISAQDLVEDLKQFKLGKTLTRNRKSSIPPPTYKPPQNIINPQRDHSREYHGSDSELTANNDDSSSTTSEKYERDVTILNHCFDDIEKFIARLQHAAAAARELERRRKNRKTKKRDMGDGMLTMRTKPPPEKEFIDIFQKFKLSFNLLAKLKAHIHDPNAPELVHFLFTPLALIVEASHDTYFDQHLPHNVISPLLTREAVNLLMNCVTSKETELWHSLGSAWLTPRDQYKGHVPPYHPVFMDGWTPENPIFDELESSMDKYNRDPHEGPYSDYNDYPSSQDNLYDSRSNDNHHHPSEKERERERERDLPPNIGDSTKSDISVDSIENRGDHGYGRSQEGFLDELQNRGANIVQVTYPRTANNDKELTVVRGEFLEILDNSRKWWKARNSRGQTAHVPHTIVTQYQVSGIIHNPIYTQQNRMPHRPESPFNSHGHSSGGQDHMQNQSQSKNNADWIKDRLDVVDNYSMNSINFDENAVIPPPPPPPGHTPPPTPKVKKNPIPKEPNIVPLKSEETQTPRKLVRSNSIQSMQSVHEELSTVLAQKKPPPRKLKVKQTPEVYIDQKSSAAEVQKWLKVKGFDTAICNKFKGVSGNDILDLDKRELEKVCGKTDGHRLFSQLILAKSCSQYETVSKKEFQLVLAKRRQKVEEEDDD